MEINRVAYQERLRDKGESLRYRSSYIEFIASLTNSCKVHYRIRMEEELMNNLETPGVLRGNQQARLLWKVPGT